MGASAVSFMKLFKLENNKIYEYFLDVTNLLMFKESSLPIS